MKQKLKSVDKSGELYSQTRKKRGELAKREHLESFVHIDCENCGKTTGLLRNRVYENIKCEDCIAKIFEKINKEKKDE